jgi:lipopolysaccharide heptosyltransferase II
MVWSRAAIYHGYVLALSKVSKKRPTPKAIRAAKKVLVIAQSGIGNLILTFPLIETIAKKLDHPKVDVLVSPRGGAELLKNLEYINEVFVSDNIKQLEKPERLKLFEKVASRGYDMVVTSFICNDIESALLAVHSKAQIRAVHTSPARLRPDKLYNIVVERQLERHEIQLNLDLARALGFEPVTEEPRLVVTEEELGWARGFLKDLGVPDGAMVVGFHPGCYKDMLYKRWTKFDELGKLLVKKMDAWVLVTGGPEEKELAETVVSGIGKNTVLAAGKTSLRQSAALIKCCKAFVSNDSGLMHMAGAVGTPVVGIFGPTDLRRTGPAGKHVIVRHDPGCAPCYVRPGDKIGCPDKIKCLEAITPEEVLSAVKGLMERA